MTTAPARAELLRLEVGLLRRRESRRNFDLTVFVGTLGGERDSFVVPARDVPALDSGLRVDVVSALLDRSTAPPGTAWLVRRGEPELHDDDLAWLAAADTAFAMHGHVLESFYVVTRYGWLEVRTQEHRTWKRLRL